MNDTATAPLSEREQKQELTERGNKFLELARGLRIETDADFQRADELNSKGAREIKAIKEFMDPHVKRAHDAHKALTADCKKMIDPIDQGCRMIGTEMAKYRQKKEQERREEEARLAKEEAERQAQARKAEDERRLAEASELEAQGKKEEADAVVNAPPPSAKTLVLPQPQTSIPKTKTSFREKWSARVVDFAKLTDDYKLPNQKALDGIAQSTKGKVKIAGVVFECEQIPVKSSR